MNSKLLGILATVLVTGAIQANDADWKSAYISALANIEKGQYEVAVASLEQAISINPEPLVGGLDYLPYIHLAIAHFELGQNNAARDALVQSHVNGAAPATTVGKSLIDAYGERIMTAPIERPVAEPVLVAAEAVPVVEDTKPVEAEIATVPVEVAAELVQEQAEVKMTDTPVEEPAAVSEPEPAVEAPDPVVAVASAVPAPVRSDAVLRTPKHLDEEQVSAIRTSVLKDCPDCNASSDNRLPWYFHYQLGVDLLAAGDAERALTSFIRGAKLRSDSSRESRTYGMWFIDYLPYYQIALANARLGNWNEAWNALQISASLGEFSPLDQDYEQYTSLETLVSMHATGNG